MKCFRSPRSEWITGMDVAEWVASSWKIFASAVQDSSSSAAMDLEVWGIGFGLHPAHKTCYFSGSLKYFKSLFWFSILIHCFRANVNWSLPIRLVRWTVQGPLTALCGHSFPVSEYQYWTFPDTWRVTFSFVNYLRSISCQSFQVLPNVSLCMLEVEWTWCSVLCEAVR